MKSMESKQIELGQCQSVRAPMSLKDGGNLFLIFGVALLRIDLETGRFVHEPRETRLCACGEEIETEEHFLTSCVKYVSVRNHFNCRLTFNVSDIFSKPFACSKYVSKLWGTRELDHRDV